MTLPALREPRDRSPGRNMTMVNTPETNGHGGQHGKIHSVSSGRPRLRPSAEPSRSGSTLWWFTRSSFPAVMQLFGKRNWHLSKAVDRVLPRVRGRTRQGADRRRTGNCRWPTSGALDAEVFPSAWPATGLGRRALYIAGAVGSVLVATVTMWTQNTLLSRSGFLAAVQPLPTDPAVEAQITDMAQRQVIARPRAGVRRRAPGRHSERA
jgi:hypothetical protein